jgi:hypothetical protein
VYSSLITSNNITGRVAILQAEWSRRFGLISGRAPDVFLLLGLLSHIFNWYREKWGQILNMITALPLVNTEAKNAWN